MSAAEPESLKPNRRLRVLVVEDNADSAASMAELLATLGFDASIAIDGAQAVEKAYTFQPDVILLDIGLPVMDGYHVAEELRQMPVASSALIVAVTGYGQPEDKEKSYKSGIDLHITKPVNVNFLREILKTYKQEFMS